MFTSVAFLCLSVAIVTAQYGSQNSNNRYQPQSQASSSGYGQTKGSSRYQQPTYKPHPYQFGYQIKDAYGNQQNREEAGDAYGTVKGTYGIIDKHGIFREVAYTADDYGFKAYIKSNEPGTANQNPADVTFESNPVIVQYEATNKGYGKGSSSGYGKKASGYGQASSYSQTTSGYGKQTKTTQKGYGNIKGSSYGDSGTYSMNSQGYPVPKYPSQYY